MMSENEHEFLTSERRGRSVNEENNIFGENSTVLYLILFDQLDRTSS